MTFFADVFPINLNSIPPLFAYQITTVEDDKSSLGGKLAYRLKSKFGGNWVWFNNQLISDKEVPDDTLSIYLKELWQSEKFLSSIQTVKSNLIWQPSAWECGDFVARGIIGQYIYTSAIKNILNTKIQNFGKLRIDRDYTIRGWAIGETPAVSISVSSNIVHTQNLAQFVKGVQNHQELINMMVVVISQDFKGEIVEITGELSQHRERLLTITSDETTRNLIKKAPDNELTVKISTRTNQQYIYIASMLRPVVRMGDLKRFGVDPRQVTRGLKLDPQTRFDLIREIASVGISNQIISEGFSAKQNPHLFLTSKEFSFIPQLRVGKNQIHSGQRVYQSLQKYGLFSRSQLFPDKDHPIRVAIINASAEAERDALKSFLAKLNSAIESLDFKLKSVKIDGASQKKIEQFTRTNIENAVNRFIPEKPDILLALFPGDAGQEQADEDDEESMYHVLKSHTIRNGIASQVVYEDTFQEEYAMENIVLGILAKTKNIPFVLATPLPYADIVVGIDIARRAKKKLAGSINSTAIARIYFNDGQFLRYAIHDAPIDGETIPSKVLRGLFPMKEFQGKRVIIHRDGLFRGEEKSALKNWASEINAQFMLVEVIKSGTPRLYQQTTKIDMPIKGTVFKVSKNEAFLISSPPPFKGSTPRPLHVRTDESISIEEALHSILSLTLLHYGSVREPRLPVTIHYSDKISELSLLGIKPKDLEGDLPFWL